MQLPAFVAPAAARAADRRRRRAESASPSGAGVNPVAFATAAISIALLVPSRNELNMRALKSPAATMLRREAVVRPHRVGRGRRGTRADTWCPCPRRRRRTRRRGTSRPSRRSSAGWSPYASEIHDAGFTRAAREKRPGERVGFDVDHHHVLAMRETTPARGGCPPPDCRSPR